MTLSLASFDKLSIIVQSLVLAALSAPVFIAFAVRGDLARGALAWTFLGALMIALNARRDNSSLSQLLIPAVILSVLHIPFVVGDPLRGAPFFGGIIRPIALVDVCVDYAFIWLWQKIVLSPKS